MAIRMPGLWRAIVYDTDEFKDSGKIKVHIQGLSAGTDTYELAEIMTPFGGLPNMGMISLPPIGAEGFVLFERETDEYPIWVGSVMRSWGKELKDSYGNPVEVEDPSQLVIKTQYTKKEKGGEDLTSKDNRVENIIKLSDGEMTLAKVRQDSDKYSYQKSSYAFADQPYNLMKISDTEIQFSFKFKDNSKTNTISLKEDKVEMAFDPGTGDMTATVETDKITLKAKGSIVTINKDGNIEIMPGGDKKVILAGSDGTGTLYEGFRDFVNNSYNSHTHGTPSGPSSPPMSPYTGSSSAKSNKVKLS